MGSGRPGGLNLSGSLGQGGQRFMKEANRFVSLLKTRGYGGLGFEGRHE